MEYRHKKDYVAVVYEVMCVEEVVGSNPTSHVAHGSCMENAATY